MMLIKASELDVDNRVNCYLTGWVALDSETGAYLRRSAGHHKAGKTTKYYLCQPGSDAQLIRAYSDDEALKIANIEVKSE